MLSLSFDPFPTLETSRLVLRAVTQADVAAIFRIQADPEVTRYLGRAPAVSIEEIKAKVAEIESGVRDCTSIRWGITERGDGELLGTVGLWRWNKLHRWAEVGYELTPSAWGKGIMTEALRASLKFGFEVMAVHRVEGNVDPGNSASMRVLERVGFVREGVLRENWLYDGQFTDTVTYGLLHRELR